MEPAQALKPIKLPCLRVDDNDTNADTNKNYDYGKAMELFEIGKANTQPGFNGNYLLSQHIATVLKLGFGYLYYSL